MLYGGLIHKQFYLVYPRHFVVFAWEIGDRSEKDTKEINSLSGFLILQAFNKSHKMIHNSQWEDMKGIKLITWYHRPPAIIWILRLDKGAIMAYLKACGMVSVSGVPIT